MTSTDIWTYREAAVLGVDVARGVDIAGFGVEAVDGGIGKVDEATYDVGTSYIVVDTGPWIFGKKVLLPAGVVERIDLDEEKVYVNRTKDQIKDSPEFDEASYRDEGYRTAVGSYYGPEGRGYVR
ncbi:MAG TPA: PRC-barrel domain-containing protein [Gaiellaceae bacterium]|nr:PRC-barrel domain-containing protein [Gaiellaceae bacterium]